MFSVSSLLRRPVRVELPLFARAARRSRLPEERGRLLAEILELNPSATPDFLDHFADAALTEYLAHLHNGLEPRGSAWIRREGRPAIVHRLARGD
jgi:hypothetical protein